MSTNRDIDPALAAKALRLTTTIGEAVRQLGSVPSGELYARCMGYMSLEVYEACIRALVRAGVVSQRGHLLTWVG